MLLNHMNYVYNMPKILLRPSMPDSINMYYNTTNKQPNLYDPFTPNLSNFKEYAFVNNKIV